jgi:hypothetical protein
MIVLKPFYVYGRQVGHLLQHFLEQTAFSISGLKEHNKYLFVSDARQM